MLYQTTVDVAVEPEEAVDAIRKIVGPMAKVWLVSPSGPGGGYPVVGVETTEHLMRLFITSYHSTNYWDPVEPSWVQPPLPPLQSGVATASEPSEAFEVSKTGYGPRVIGFYIREKTTRSDVVSHPCMTKREMQELAWKLLALSEEL